MIKRFSLLITILMLLVLSVSIVPVWAEQEPVVLSSSARADFPAQLKFDLSARSTANITDIRLRYTVEREQFADVVSESFIEFTPAPTVNVSWTLDMIKTGGLPPGAVVNYWWIIRNTAGKQIETKPARIQFDDSRYHWQSQSQGKMTIYWYEGDNNFARGLMDIAQTSLSRLADATGAQLEKPARIFVYANSNDLRGSMIYPQEWTGGVTFTRYGIIALSIKSGDLEWAQKVIPHELTHLVINQVVLNPYNDLPRWLDEGLAVYMEGSLSWDLKAYLEWGIANNNLLTVRTLSSPFSAYTDEAALSYGQSYSIVQFLISRYGQSKMLELLQTFRQGSTYDDAFEIVYGFDMDGLDTVWKQSIGVAEPPTETKTAPQESPLNSAMIGVLAGLSTILVLVLGLLWEHWTWNRRR